MPPENQNNNLTDEFGKLDIGGWSILHFLFTRPPIQEENFMKTYLIPWFITAFLFYGIPIYIAIYLVPNALFPDKSLGRNIGLLGDWNVMFGSIVSLPVLVILMLSGRNLVPKWISTIIQGKSKPKKEEIQSFVSYWNKNYKVINIIGQLVGVAVAVSVAYANYKTVLGLGAKNWPITDGSLNIAGWIGICWQLPFPYWILSIYIFQVVATIYLLYNLTQKFEIKVLPFHHDNCCGLKSVGHIGLRNQYLLAVVGMNLLVLLAVNIKRGDPSTAYLLIAGVLAYLIVGPLVFIGPLLPFRKSMLLAKQTQQAKVSSKLQNEYTRIVDELENNSMGKEDEDLIDRLQKLRTLVKRIPVWPFDTSTLRKFFTAYIFPFITAIVSFGVNYLIKVINDLLPK